MKPITIPFRLYAAALFCVVGLALTVHAQTPLYWTQGDNQWVISSSNFWSTTSGGAVNSPWVNDSAAVIETTNPSLTLAPNDKAISVTTLTINNGLTLIGSSTNTRILTITTGGSGDLTFATTSATTAVNGSYLRLYGTTAWNGTISTAGDAVATKNRVQVHADAVGVSTKFNLNGSQQVQLSELSSGSTFTIGELKGTTGQLIIGTGSSSSGTTTLRVQQATDTTFAGAFSKSGSGKNALAKAGDGSLTLSGANTIDTTTVEDGGLLVTGSIDGAVTVENGAFFGGSGTVGAVSLNNGAILQYTLGGSNLTMTSLLQGEAGAYVFDFAGSGATDTTYTLSSVVGAGFTASSFSYTNLSSGLSGTFSLDGSSLTFTTSAIPEPSVAGAWLGLAALVGAIAAKRRRIKF